MKKTKSVIYWLFAAYILLMLWLLFGQRMGVTSPGTYWDQVSSRINLIPLQTITEFWNNLHGGGRSHAFINLAGNVVMFVPLLGSLDVDDLILNMIGVVIGYPERSVPIFPFIIHTMPIRMR